MFSMYDSNTSVVSLNIKFIIELVHEDTHMALVTRV
jgi:hypothetical protein